MRIKQILIYMLSLIYLVCWGVALPAPAQDAPAERINEGPLEAVGYIAWWFHSALGYHPAILLRLENTSGKYLGPAQVKFQARFTNLRDGYVNVAREEMRVAVEKDKNFYILLKGPRAFELPIDESLWPRMECKVMCRIGEESDDTNTLLVAKLANVAMTYEDALGSLTKLPNLPRRGKRTMQASNPGVPEKPLIAMAGSLNPKDNKPKHTIGQFLESTSIPGLGDDFYDFDKKFGTSIEYDAGTKDKTWVRYQSIDPQFSVIVGSRGQSGKADWVVASIPANQIKGEQQVRDVAKAISGKFRSEAVGAPDHSVRYLPTGRLEFSTLSAQNYRAIYFVPGATSSSFIIVVTRLPGNVLNLLRQEAQRTKLLKFLVPIIGSDDSK